MIKKNNQNKTVAIIEDDQILVKALGDELKDAGYQVIKAFNGRDGLALVLKEHPDLILLDIVMPEMDGNTMLSSLRQDPWGRDVPVIILSDLNEASKVTKALVQQAFDYMVKSSWTLDDIIKRVNDKLRG